MAYCWSCILYGSKPLHGFYEVLSFIFIALYLLYIVGIVMTCNTMIFMPPLPSVVPTLLLLPFLFPTTLCPLTLFCNDPVRFSRVAYRRSVKSGLQETVHLISGSTTEVNVSPSTLPTINRVQTPRLGWGLGSYFCLLVKKLKHRSR